jgi:integrase
MSKRRTSGEGTVFKDPRGYWIAEFTTPDGTKKRKASKLQNVVVEWLSTSLNQVRSGTYVKDDHLTVSDFFIRFMKDTASVTYRPKTIDGYRWALELHLLPEIGDIPLTQLKSSHLQALYRKKLESGLSKSSVVKLHNIVKRILNQAVKFGLLVRNPADAAQPPKPDDKPLQTLGEAQFKALLEGVRDHPYYPIYCVAIGCGLREGEILGLRKQDVLLDQGLLRVEQVISQVRGKTFFGYPKSDSSKRTVGLPDFVSNALQKVWENANPLLFHTRNNTPISPRNLLRHFHLTLKRLGIPRVRFHSLRHTFVTLLLARNIPPKDIQAIAGHSSFQITYNTYGHLIPGYQEQAARKLDGLV